MPARLLEREATLAALSRAVTEAAAGRGSVVLVTGEAGIGKTSLVRAFAREARRARADPARRRCDDLMAPRTLGPLRDAALGADGPLAAALADDEPVDDVFTALLEELAAEPPTVLVVEDVHWADDATLDVLGYAARRIERGRRLLVLTFRDDEVDPRPSAPAPARRARGLPGAPARRSAPLSREAVRRLSGRHRRRRRGACTASRAATRSSSRRRSRRRATPCPRAWWRPCWRASAASAPTAATRSTSCPSCRRTSSLDLAAELLGTAHRRARGGRAGRRARGPRRTASRSGTSSPAGRSSAACPALRRRSLNAAVVAALRAQARPERARVMHHAVEAQRRRDDPRRRPERRRARRRAPARTGRRSRTSSRCCPHLRPARRARARRRARRLRVGALQRASLPRRRRGRPRGARSCTSSSTSRSRSASASSGPPGTCSWPGETDEAERVRRARGGDPRADRRRARRSPTPRSTRARSSR